MFDYENNENFDSEKRDKIFEWEEYSGIYFVGSDKTEIISKGLMDCGIKNKDAVHLACAIETGCDYFITTDNGVYKKRDYIKDIKVINPIEFFIETGGIYEK